MNLTDIANRLDEYGIHLLAAGIKRADTYEANILLELTLSVVSADISSESTVFDDKLIKSLKNFETEYRHEIATIALTTQSRGFWDIVGRIIDRFSMAKFFGVLLTAFSCWYIAMITITETPESNNEIKLTILGFVLGTLMQSIISFFLGISGNGSNNKQNSKVNSNNTKDNEN